VDLSDSSRTFASAEEWVSLVRLARPTEAAPAPRRLALFLLLIENRRYFGELFKVLILAIRKD